MMMRGTRRAIDRLAPAVKTIADDRGGRGAVDLDDAPGGELRRRVEAHDQAANARTQRLSRELAHLYRRNVIAAGNLDAETRIEVGRDGQSRIGKGAPAAGYIRTGPYRKMIVSWAMADHLLRRDRGSFSGG